MFKEEETQYCPMCEEWAEKYKQLDNEYEGFAVKYTDMEIALKAKEQECEKLKKQLTILDDEDVVVEITVKQLEEYKKLKQTLAEIKEIAEDDCKTCTVKLLGEDKINCKRCYKTKILQKCEVIDERNAKNQRF